MAAHTAALNFRLDLPSQMRALDVLNALSDNRRMQPPPNLACLDVRRKTLIIREVAAISLAGGKLAARFMGRQKAGAADGEESVFGFPIRASFG